MLAAQICREWHLGVLTSTRLPASRVPRCLFGQPNPRETIELLQEALDVERARFAKRWGVDPTAEDEDKENNTGPNTPGKVAVIRLTPSKRRAAAACPYPKQTCIHDYWRSRKTSESGKKSSSGALTEIKPNQQQSPPKQPNFTNTDKLHSSPK